MLGKKGREEKLELSDKVIPPMNGGIHLRCFDLKCPSQHGFKWDSEKDFRAAG